MQPAIDNDDAGNVLMTYHTTENHLGPMTRAIKSMVWPYRPPDRYYQECGPTSLDETNSYANGFTVIITTTITSPSPRPLGTLWNTAWSRNTGQLRQQHLMCGH